MFSVADNAMVYVLSSDGKSYSVGRPMDVRKGVDIRAFSISEGGDIAMFITVKDK